MLQRASRITLASTKQPRAGTDAIFNGADDDASGCVAVLELARALASGKRTKANDLFRVLW